MLLSPCHLKFHKAFILGSPPFRFLNFDEIWAFNLVIMKILVRPKCMLKNIMTFVRKMIYTRYNRFSNIIGKLKEKKIAPNPPPILGEQSV